MSPDALAILKRQEGLGEWVFVDGKGNRIRDEYVSKKVKKYMRSIGLPEELHFHSLRATCASWGLKEGVPIYAVKSLLGHASVKTTETYASYDRESLRLEVQKIFLPPEA
jgi:integrase